MRIIFFTLMCVCQQSIAQTATMSNSALAGRLFVGLVSILLIIYGLTFLLKRFKFSQLFPASGMKVVANLPLGTREKAVLIEVEGRKMLLGVAPGRVSHLQTFESIVTEHEVKEPLEEPQKNHVNFSGYLREILKNGTP